MIGQRISWQEYRTLVAAGQRPRVTRRRSEEEALHRACTEWLALNRARHPLLAWMIHVPNGGRRPKGEAGKLKALGVKPGVPDLLLPFPVGGRAGLAIELKATKGRLSEAQKEWIDRLSAYGWMAVVVRSLDEFVSTIEEYLSPAADHSRDKPR